MLLDQEPSMVVAGMADRITGLLAQLEGSQPDVLLLDWDLMVEPIEDLFNDIDKLECQPEVIVLSSEPQLKAPILVAGGDFVITRDAPPDTLLSVLNDIWQSKIKKPNIG